MRLHAEDGHLVLEVPNHGKGIDENFVPQIFERFCQVENVRTRSHGEFQLHLAKPADIRQLVAAVLRMVRSGKSE